MAKLAAQHVDAPPDSVPGDDALDEIRAKHEQAIARFSDAKSRLATVSSKHPNQVANSSVTSSNRDHGVATSRQRHLEEHLENLRLQRRHRNLQLLSHHSEEAEKIASEENILEGFESVARTTTRVKDSEQQVALTATQRHLESLIDSAKVRTTNLELAIVKARQQLRLEHSLLERVKDRSKGGRNGEPASKTAFSNQSAMEATRDELQRWIEEGLAKCEQEVAALPGSGTPDMPNNNSDEAQEEHNALVDAEYEQYLEARSQLIILANALRTPLPEHETEPTSMPVTRPPPEQRIMSDDQRQKVSLQRAPHLRHKSRISIVKLGEQSGGPDLAKIERAHLPRYHHERLLNTHVTHLDVQTRAQDSRLLQSLGLLSHESHLLPSFPLSATGNVQDKSSNKLSQHQAEIDHLLRSWAFASNTADGVLRENIVRNAEETKEALERASQHLDEVHLVEDMRKEVIASHK